jgi:hypothetical protein
MKKFLFILTVITALFLTFSFAQKDSIRSYEIKSEFKINGKSIRINAINRNITIQSWNEEKVKIVTGYVKDNEEEGNKDALLEKMGISFHEMNSTINISIKEGSFAGNYISGQTINSGSLMPLTSLKNIIIYLPQTSKIAVNVKFANLNCKNAFDKLDIDITNSNLDLESVKELKLISKYGNSTIGEVKTGEVEFTNGNLSFNSIGEIDLDTKYSSVELGTVKKISFTSTNDEYEIDEVGQISGRKNYGNLRISKLNSSLDLDGVNADVKIRNIASSLNMIRIDDKYANIRLPLKSLKNYSFEVTGGYNTVYPSSNEASINENVSPESAVTKGSLGDGKGAKINIKCQNCTVDFK